MGVVVCARKANRRQKRLAGAPDAVGLCRGLCPEKRGRVDPARRTPLRGYSLVRRVVPPTRAAAFRDSSAKTWQVDNQCDLDPVNGQWVGILTENSDVYVVDVGESELGQPRRLSHITGSIDNIVWDPLGRFVVARHDDGRIRKWDVELDSPPAVIEVPPGFDRLGLSNDGSMLEAIKVENDTITTWVWAIDRENPILATAKRTRGQGRLLGMDTGSSRWSDCEHSQSGFEDSPVAIFDTSGRCPHRVATG